MVFDAVHRARDGVIQRRRLVLFLYVGDAPQHATRPHVDARHVRLHVLLVHLDARLAAGGVQLGVKGQLQQLVGPRSIRRKPIHVVEKISRSDGHVDLSEGLLGPGHEVRRIEFVFLQQWILQISVQRNGSERTDVIRHDVVFV